jgi:hypothetical protein
MTDADPTADEGATTPPFDAAPELFDGTAEDGTT